MGSIYDDIRAALFGIWHRRWIALGVAWLVCLAGWLLVAMIPNSYETQARIYVQLTDPLAAQVGIGAGDRKQQIDQIRDTLTSSAHLEKVIRSTRLGQGITSRKQMDGAIAGLSKAIKVSSEQDNLFVITARVGSGQFSDAENARLSRDIVQAMIDIFRDESLNGNLRDLQQTLKFMDQQLDNRQHELQAAEQRRMDFEAKHPELAEGGVSLVQRLEQDRAQMRGLDSDIAAAQSALAAINSQMGSTPPTVPGSGPTGGPRAQLAQLQTDLAGLRARGLTDNHPDVIALRNQIAAMRAQVAADPGSTAGSVPNPAYTTLQSIRAERQANVQALQGRRAALEGDVAQANAAQSTNPDLTLEAQNISRDYDVLKAQYDKMLQDREELRLRGQVQSAQGAMKFQILDPPVVPRGPAAPNRPLLLVVVLVAGLGAGLGAAFALGELRSTFSTAAKLERSVGLPVLGTVSRVVSASGLAERRRQVWRFAAATGALGAMYIVLVMLEYVQRRMVA